MIADDEPDNIPIKTEVDDAQNLIRDDVFNKDLGDDIKLPDPISIKIEQPNTDDKFPQLSVKTEDFISDPDLSIHEPKPILKNIPSLKWTRPADRFKKRVRQQSSRKKVFSKDKSKASISDVEIPDDDYIPPRERLAENLKCLRKEKEKYRKKR